MHSSPPRPTRVTADRQHTLRGRRNIEWFFANRRWVKLSGSIVQSAYAKRAVPEGERSLQFFLVASKRDYRRAHDRNKIKRWLRAAIAEIEEFSRIEAGSSEQVLVMLRISRPIDSVDFPSVLNSVRQVASRLGSAVGLEGNQRS